MRRKFNLQSEKRRFLCVISMLACVAMPTRDVEASSCRIKIEPLRQKSSATQNEGIQCVSGETCNLSVFLEISGSQRQFEFKFFVVNGAIAVAVTDPIPESGVVLIDGDNSSDFTISSTCSGEKIMRLSQYDKDVHIKEIDRGELKYLVYRRIGPRYLGYVRVKLEP